jgi:hypothetical protein
MNNTSKNQKDLYRFSIALVVLSVLDALNLLKSIFDFFSNGGIEKNFKPEALVFAKWTFGIIYSIGFLYILALLLIGIKGVGVSKNPSEKKGYITLSKVFLVYDILAFLNTFRTLASGKYGNLIQYLIGDAILLAIIVVLIFFIKKATVVRENFINSNNKRRKK